VYKALNLANLTIFFPPDSCLQAKIKAGSTIDSVYKKSGQMKKMLNYRTVLLAQTGMCSGILPMALRSKLLQAHALSISASRILSPQ
jgi:hypothetical protein